MRARTMQDARGEVTDHRNSLPTGAPGAAPGAGDIGFAACDAGEAIDEFCTACKRTVIDEIRHILQAHRWNHDELDELVLDYPLRPAKGLRPALCIATARSLGATEEAVTTSAAVIELLHNAFLIHDDVEDESLFRRGEPTLQRAHGLPIAVNVADGMFALALVALLDNLETLGLRASLAIFRQIVDMLWTTVGGQALELSWIRANTWQFPDYRAAYEDLVVRKTAVYSFVVPTQIACVAAAVPGEIRDQLAVFSRHVGIAFQIADDLLNLRDDAAGYGKEVLGDLWEGKRTLMLLHALHAERDPELVRMIVAILGRPRPAFGDLRSGLEDVAAVVDDLHASGHVDGAGRAAVLAALRRAWRARSDREAKTESDIRIVAEFIARHGGAGYARGVALEHVRAAEYALAQCYSALAPGDGRDFLFALPAYVLERLR
jgi:geranylgeranyl diphosphate synthase, type II